MLQTETADIETSSDAYASRFAGAVGAWFLTVQEQIIVGMLKHTQTKTVLDVGGGHGQLAYPLADHGFKVHVSGSAEICAHRLSSLLAKGKIEFSVSNILALPFESRSFDAVTSIRLVTHCTQWQALISELCRVSNNLVIIDYPPARSFNILYSLLFFLKRKAEGDTRPYRIFNDSEIESIFRSNGYQLQRRKPQFFLPMVVHRKIKVPYVSPLIEGFFRMSGLTYIFGSPTIACFVRT